MTASDENGDSSQGRIDELLLRWDEAQERGEELTIAELCRDCPDLEPELRRRTQVLAAWEGFVDTAPATEGVAQTAPPIRMPGPTVITLDLTDLKFHARGGLGAVF